MNDPVVANLLTAATAEFAQFGFEGARLERIVANTKTSKRMLYYHFGSKAGLYQAVLEHAFESARVAEQAFDPNQGSPVEALCRFTEIAFDSLSDRPDFVRLLTFENLGGAANIKGSSLIAQLNKRGLAQVEAVLTRGKVNGDFRTDVAAIDVFMNLVGLSYYHVANSAGYLVEGVGFALNPRLSDEHFHSRRRLVIVESIRRFVVACL
jgi:AcrR family transcriptional regulator